MRVLFLAGREQEYTRNEVLLRAFERFATVTAVTDHAAGKSIPRRSMEVLFRAIPKLLHEKYDLVFVGFYGHLLMLPVRLIARRPILFDAFVSTYDTLIFDRQVASPKSLVSRLAFVLDWVACRFSTHILLDTPMQVAYFCQTFSLPRSLFTSIPVGCNEEIFVPRPVRDRGRITRVLYYCTYLPLHGVEFVIQAAAQLVNEDIAFRLIGAGPGYERIQSMVKTMGLKNIEFLPNVPLETLANEISEADICLGGHFGVSDKSGRVVPGKIYQILASGRPVIASTSLANRSLLTHRENAYLCPAGDATALAAAILELHRDPDLAVKLGRNGRMLYENVSSETAITNLLEQASCAIAGGHQGVN